MNLAIYSLFIAIFRPFFLPDTTALILKCTMILYVYIFLFVKCRRVLLNIAIPFCLSVLLSSMYNYIIGYTSLKDGPIDGLLFSLCIYAIYTLPAYCSMKQKSDQMSKCLLKITTVYCLINAITFIRPVMLDEYGMKIYAFGSKFMACYFMIFFTGLFAIVHHEKINNLIYWKALYLSIIVLDFIVGIITDCSTGIVSSAVFLLFLFTSKKLYDIVMSPKVIIILVFASVIIPFIFGQITKLQFVQHLIVDVLGRNINLTRRTVLYDNYILPVINNRIWIGYGYGNRAVFKYSGSYGNSQNGLLEHLVNYGLLGVTSLILLIHRSFSQSMKSMKTFAAALIVCALIVAGIVEVSYNWFFFYAIALVRWLDPIRQTDKLRKSRKRRLIKGIYYERGSI